MKRIDFCLKQIVLYIKMKAIRNITILLVIVSLASCVSGRKFQELEAKQATVLEENEKLRKENESVKTSNRELEAELEDLKVRTEALKVDTTLLGSSLRHMQDQYDKINELNELLSSKSNKLLNDAAEENRKLLEELNAAQLNLQNKEDALLVLEKDIETKQSNLDNMSSELGEREARLKELEDLLAKKDAMANALKDKVSNALMGFQDKGLSVRQENGKVYVSLEAKLLFPSGSTKIDSQGKTALIDLAKAIETQEDLDIIVEGHTDTDKISSSSIPRNNWELSVLRATAVVELMVANSSVQPTILSAAGRSEFIPIDPEDKAKNRRIEIILVPNLNELYDLIEG